MPELTYASIRASLSSQPLFEDKTWQVSPAAWALTAEQHAQLQSIGTACLEYHQALETLYTRSAAGKNGDLQERVPPKEEAKLGRTSSTSPYLYRVTLTDPGRTNDVARPYSPDPWIEHSLPGQNGPGP